MDVELRTRTLCHITQYRCYYCPQVCVFGFDCLYHNGVSLLHEPLTKRRDMLHAGLKEVTGQVSLATTKISNDVEELEVGERALWVWLAVCLRGVCLRRQKPWC